MRYTVALFGEAEKGQWNKPLFIRSLQELVDVLGSPPEMSQGLFFAIQSLHFERDLLFFRVEEEGYSKKDYFYGLSYLKKAKEGIHALFLPQVGDEEILTSAEPILKKNKSHLIMTEEDLFDYLTNRPPI